ncbi:hypothetical protein KOI40_04225 [Aestuariicella sp. G3-2]|uniref:hypothetical protein n=1 Tax=Pseudomaricurvus albidus TaxID=2842452 RepID=UPI001C0E4FB7|nr:hypothetical protein [Aestuariicella albida]MBU3069013.1 hypothetical protein [Aestuariicella albida]
MNLQKLFGAQTHNKHAQVAAKNAAGLPTLRFGSPWRGRYEKTMNRLLAIFLLPIALCSLASPGITEQEITYKNARDLGFAVTVEVTSEATSIKLIGPKSINGNCTPARSGNALMSAAGEELMVYQANLQPGDSVPVAFGYFTQKNTNMSVWLDYFCPPGQELESRRFVIPSVAKYLITSQSTSRLSAPDSLRYASAAGY